MTQAAKLHSIDDCPQNGNMLLMNNKIDTLLGFSEDTKDFHREMLSSMKTLAENAVHVANLMTRQDKTERDVDVIGERQRKMDLVMVEQTTFIAAHKQEAADDKQTLRSFKVSLGVALLSTGIIAGVTFTFFVVDRLDYTSSKKTTTTETRKSLGP